jgi:hypothetical protein
MITLIHSLSLVVYFVTKYIKFSIYINRRIADSSVIYLEMIYEVYIVNNLKTNLLIRMDTIGLYRI